MINYVLYLLFIVIIYILLIVTPYKLYINILLLITLLFFINQKNIEGFNGDSETKINDVINSEFIQDIIFQITPNGKCITKKKFKKVIKKVLQKVDIIPKSKFFINLLLTDKRIEDFYNKCSNKNDKICKKDIELFMKGFLKKFLK